MSVKKGTLVVAPPFNLAATLESGQAFRWRCLDEGWYWGTIGKQAVALCQRGDELVFRCQPGNEEQLSEALYDYFRLEDDLETICREIATDEGMARAIERHRGLRLLRQDPWECLVSFVCSAVSNIPRISRTLEAMARRYGEPMALGDHTLSTFPRPERLARAGEGGLRGLGLGFRAKYVTKIAEVVAEGGVELALLRRESYWEAKAALMALPGIGEKVADCILVFSLDKLEGFPVDRWVRRGLEAWYFRGERPMSNAELRSWAQERWGRYAGYAQQYLFQDSRLAGMKRR